MNPSDRPRESGDSEASVDPRALQFRGDHPATSPHVVPARYITADIPPLGGVIKVRPEDFLVQEIPLYQPSGQGEHIYLFIEKRGLSTFDMIAILSRHFNVPRGAIGVAGLKDKAAITQQVVSIHTPGKTAEDFPQITHERLSVQWADLHANKLRQGHLLGNRFSIRIRNVPPTGVLTAKRVLDRLVSVGVPNRIGEQRFGHLQNNHLVGRALIAEDHTNALDALLGPSTFDPSAQAEARAAYARGAFAEALALMPRHAHAEKHALRALAEGRDARRAMLSIDDSTRRFYLTAFQSAVFNAVLDRRLESDSHARLLPGDLAFKHANRAVFAVDQSVLDDPTTPQRLSSFEISPSGPMWAAGMMRAGGEIDAMEVAALAEAGLATEALDRFAAEHRESLEGTRRPLRIPVIDPDAEGGVDEHGSYVRVAFELPRGSFATVVLREIIKPSTGLMTAHHADPGSADAEDDHRS